MAPGSKDWQPSSFSPRTGLVYMPHENMCMDEEYTAANYIAGTPYIGADVRYYAGPGGNMGELMAWDPISRQERLDHPGEVSGLEWNSGDRRRPRLLRHHGWLVQGRQRSDWPVLWQFKTGSGIIGQPISYKGPDGKQYIAILSGVGGWPGAVISGDLDTARRHRGYRLGLAQCAT